MMENNQHSVHSVWHAELEVILLALDDADVECDGMTFVITHILDRAGVPHHPFTGYVRDKLTGTVIAPHLWIVLGDGYVVDMRLRMWLGDDDRIPNGVFKPEQFPSMEYVGERTKLAQKSITDDILNLITDGRFADVVMPRGFADENPALSERIDLHLES